MNGIPASPTSYQAAIFRDPRQPLDLQWLDRPELRHREALVHVELCTICGSDLHTFSGSRIEPTPSILGHEIVGVIEEVSDPPLCDLDGQPLRQGDRVTWSTCISCGTCERCLRGVPQKCLQLAKYGHDVAEGHQALSGGLAEAVLLRPGSSVLRVDSDIPLEVVCPANCATATIAAAYRVSGEIENRRVLIFGAGMLGLTAAAFAATNGASQVVVCDVDADRLRHAERFGATATVEWQADLADLRRLFLDFTGSETFDLVVEVSGNADAVEAACACAEIDAAVVLVGSVMKSRDIRINPEKVIRSWLSIHGVHNYAPEDLRTAVRFLEQQHTHYPFAELVAKTFALTDINQAFEFAVQERPIRVGVRPENSRPDK